MNSDEELRDVLADFMEQIEEVGSEIEGSPTELDMHKLDAVYETAITRIKDRDTKHDAYVIGEDLDMSNFKEGEPDHYMAMGYNDAKHWSRERAALKEVKK